MNAGPAIRPTLDVQHLAAEGDRASWRHAEAVADAVEEAERARGPGAGRRLQDELAEHAGLDRNTVRRRVQAVRWLRAARLDVAESVPIGIVTMVATDRSAGDEAKRQMIDGLVAAARSGTPIDREEVRRRLRSLRPPTRIAAREEMGGDLWWFDRPRFGKPGPDRIPGQAFLNLIDRFLPKGGSVLSAMAGDGTVLDAAAASPRVGRYFGFDHQVDPDVAGRHVGHVTTFDPTAPDWAPLCPNGLFDMLVLTPPLFSFTATSSTGLGALTEIETYLAALEHVVHGAATALVGGGVFVVATRHAADFGEREPVWNLVHRVTAMVEDAVGEVFLGAPVVGFGPRKRKAHVGAWLVPSATHLLTYRKTL